MDKTKKAEGLDPTRFAGFWIRVAAFAIDFIALILISIVAAIVFIVVERALSINLDIEVASSFAGFLINAGYYIFMTYTYGATIGKKIFGLRVETVSGEKLDIGTVIVREVAGKFLASMLLGLGYLWVLFDKKKQGLHDKLGSTVVVKTDRDVANWKIYLTAVSFLVIVGGFFLWVLFGVFDEDFQDEIDKKQVLTIVGVTLNAAKLCVSEGNLIEKPSSKLGGGDLCSDPIGTEWPKLGAGYFYGKVDNQRFFIVKDGEDVIECLVDENSCAILE